MVQCKFFAQGNCRFGNNCRYEHSLPSGGNQGSSNRFAPLQNQNNSRNDTRNNNSSNSRQASSSRDLPFLLDRDAIVTDLTTDLPEWILSAYGPGRQAPAQLFGGEQREQSFEEMRLAYYMVAPGNQRLAEQQADDMQNSAKLQVQNALSNVDGAIDYIIKAKDDHPNRIDIVSQSVSGPQTGVFSKAVASQTSNPFASGSSQSTPNPFGAPAQTSAFGAPSQPSAFGAPSQPSAFGAPSQPSAFGASPQPGAFGAPSQNGVFGQASAMGQSSSTFGAPSAPAFGASTPLGGGTSAFGQSSALGQRPNPFGAPSGSSAFGQPSGVFGAPSVPAPNPFGGPAQTSSAFGAPSQLGAKPNPFAPAPSAPANPFGGNQQQTVGNPTAFGQPSNPSPVDTAAAPSQPSAFTQSSSNPFGAPSQPATSHPFGAPSTSAVDPFGASSSAPTNPFGAPSTQSQHVSSPFSQVNGQSAGGYVPSTGGDPSTYISKDMSGRLSTFKGKRVQYKENEPGYIGSDGAWCRIFFPDGPPSHTSQTTTDSADQYDPATEAAYKQLLETGSFPEGFIPLLPPKKEWVRWDF